MSNKRVQVVLTAPARVFKELYFTKSQMRIKEDFKDVKLKGRVLAKFLKQTEPKNRYVLNPNAKVFRNEIGILRRITHRI
jgi:hypothetical protein